MCNKYESCLEKTTVQVTDSEELDKFHDFRYCRFMCLGFTICDVISKKGPYCGRNSVFLDQLFLHFSDSIFYQNSTESEKNVFFRCSLATNIVGPDQTLRIMRSV